MNVRVLCVVDVVISVCILFDCNSEQDTLVQRTEKNIKIDMLQTDTQGFHQFIGNLIAVFLFDAVERILLMKSVPTR